MTHRTVLAAALAGWFLAPPAPAPAQSHRGAFLSYAQGGGEGGLSASRGAAHAGYAIGATAPTGIFVGARYLVGVHRLDADAAAYAREHGEGDVLGGGGHLVGAGVDAEIGVRLGPVVPYAFSGYHYLVQTVEAAVVGEGDGTIELPAARARGFAPARGVGVAILTAGGTGAFAERFRGGGRGGVMRVEGTRFGLRYAW
jgi:hypothetical protein